MNTVAAIVAEPTDIEPKAPKTWTFATPQGVMEVFTAERIASLGNSLGGVLHIKFPKASVDDVAAMVSDLVTRILNARKDRDPWTASGRYAICSEVSDAVYCDYSPKAKKRTKPSPAKRSAHMKKLFDETMGVVAFVIYGQMSKVMTLEDHVQNQVRRGVAANAAPQKSTGGIFVPGRF